MEGSIVPKRKYYHSKKKVLSFWKESNIGLRNVNYFFTAFITSDWVRKCNEISWEIRFANVRKSLYATEHIRAIW